MAQWCIPPEANGAFVCQLEDVLDVYERPYDPRYPVVCMDEMSKQLVDETRTPLPMQPGQLQRYDYEYARTGVANLFVFVEPLRGWRHLAVTDRRTRQDWATQIQWLIDAVYPDATRVTLVCANLNTHVGGALYEVFPPAEARRLLNRLDIHYTPKHGSWLNMAEIELSVVGRQCLDRRIADTATLTRELAAWEDQRNHAHHTITWQFRTADARIKLRRLYPSVGA